MQKRTRTTAQVVAKVTLVLAILSSSVVTTYAQTTPTASSVNPSPSLIVEAPSAFLGVASATGDGAIYYHGGQLNKATVEFSDELFAIDTTVRWNISLPAWTNLTSLAGGGGPKVSGHSATMSKDLSTIYLTAPSGNATYPFLYAYNVKTRSWSSEHAPAAQATLWSNRREAQLLTDPTTGALWYLGGVLPTGIEINEIDKYMSGSWSANIAAMLPKAAEGTGSTSLMNRFSAGTSHLVGSNIYLFGGFSSSGPGTKVYQSFQNLPFLNISTATPTIGTQLILGPVPRPRQDHCSVLTKSQKVIIFGGYEVLGPTTFNDVWVLDLKTWTWQQIMPLNPSQPRYGHTCNLAGANMIVYGGRARTANSTTEVGYYKDVQVYDVMKSAWLTTYIPKEDTTPTSLPIPGGPSGNVPEKSNASGLPVGGVIGIVLAVVVLVVCAIGLFIYRKRQKQIEVKEAEMEKRAYLASLGSDGQSTGDRRSRHRSHRNNPYRASASSPFSTSSKPLNGTGAGANTPGQSYTSAATAVPGSGDDVLSGPIETPGNVQYLMQHLPDGTIAVQPVYLDHQPLQLHHSPNMMYSENSRLGGVIGGSPPSATTTAPVTSSAGLGISAASDNHFVPPPSSQHPHYEHVHAPAGSGYVTPPSSTDADGQATDIPLSPTPAVRDSFTLPPHMVHPAALARNQKLRGSFTSTAGSQKSSRSTPSSPRTQNHSSSPRQARR
ncbi:hypothetical protein BGZ70_003938 [Mortierella alpina]|uniref:Galactose oxidase n=1 Tax=Mortierella alpina TaxID=64518 RepID=A0A9P6M4A9_MORAP|nr:hypothetical protein BGZ70_003938 [Mortierella alpina]